MKHPGWNDAQLKVKQLEWKRQVMLGKRKTRDETDPFDTAPRDRPTTVNPAELSLNQENLEHNIAPTAPMGL